jgi:hypothetical protein
VQFCKPGEPRDQPGGGQCHRGRHRESAPRARRALRGVVDQRQRFIDRPVKLCTGLGQFERAIDAAEQRAPDLFLERFDLVADRRLRDEKFTRGVREAQVARGRPEPAQ